MEESEGVKKSPRCGFTKLCHTILRRRSFPPVKPFAGPDNHIAVLVEAQSSLVSNHKKVRFNEELSFAPETLTNGDEVGDLPTPPALKPSPEPTNKAHRRGISTGGMKASGGAGNLLTSRRNSISCPSELALRGNILKGGNRVEVVSPARCRALTVKLDPEELKEMGNKEYRKGRYGEALSLYEQAIAINGTNAAYWSNKAAALAKMGELLVAVEQCKEAVRIQPSYYKAHHRLATLYLRLGDPIKAMHHYQSSGAQSTAQDFGRIRALRSHLAKFSEARTRKDWHMVLRETQFAFAAGADSAPQIFASQAESLLKLQRHQEADELLKRAPNFDLAASIMFYGGPTNAYILAVRALVDMASGRFEEAMSKAQNAIQLDPGNKTISRVARKVRAVTLCRAKGNSYFKDGKFEEACAAYQEGLEYEPFNSVLLCNRAACRLKRGQLEGAIEDCNLTLQVRPSYSKARLRRADLNVKMRRWEAAIRDYEVLSRENPDDEYVNRALREVHIQLMIQKKT